MVIFHLFFIRLPEGNGMNATDMGVSSSSWGLAQNAWFMKDNVTI